MVTKQSSGAAPWNQPGETVVLFDGTCKLCNGWARFVIAHDHAHRIKLASVQSSEGQALLKWAGLPTDNFNTIVLMSDNRFFVRSEAMFEILARLDAPWPWLTVLRIVPQRLRDWMYDKIALNRYKLFGQYNSILLPHADHSQRFLKSNT
jgi:predicted DCC family thiol-disulfide oxidoreductase YuxK